MAGTCHLLNYELKSKGDDDHWKPGAGSSPSWRFTQSGSVWQPPTDVFETDDQIVVMIEIAGMRGKKFQVTFDEKVLHIRGFRQLSEKAKAFHQMEISYGEFLVGLRISPAVDAQSIEATYSDGFLRVELPKLKPYRVEVRD